MDTIPSARGGREIEQGSGGGSPPELSGVKYPKAGLIYLPGGVCEGSPRHVQSLKRRSDLNQRDYKYGFNDAEANYVFQARNEASLREVWLDISRREGRAQLDARVPAQGAGALPSQADADLGG